MCGRRSANKVKVQIHFGLAKGCCIYERVVWGFVDMSEFGLHVVKGGGMMEV